MKRIVCVLLAVFICAGVFAACGKQDAEPETGKKAETESEKAGQDSETEGETGVKSNLPDRADCDFDFNVVHWTIEGQGVGEDWIPWEEISVAEDNGEGIVKAVFDRNNELEEKYGIRVISTYENAEKITHIMEDGIRTGDNPYQMVVQRGYQFQFLMTQKAFADLSSLKYVELDKPWYNQDTVNTFTFGGNTLIATSDMLLLDKSATACMFYNKDAAESQGYAGNHFYSLVNNYKWTLEEAVAVMENAYRDATGDGYSSDDFFGAVGTDSPMHYLLNGAGERFCTTDPDKYLVYTFGKERVFDVVDDTLNDLILNKTFLSSRNGYEVSGVNEAFMAERCLLAYGTLKNVLVLRNMEAPYGILPIPMYEESQHQYYSEVSPHRGSLFAVPLLATEDDEEADKIGLAIEGLSYISSYTVYPNFYNVVLEGKGTRDQESREMLKLIFDTRVNDIGIIFDFGLFANAILSLPKKPAANIGSLWAENEDVVLTEMEKTIKALKGVNE
ncbi:MAG: extracellular solute-binding protein [Clostridia bacterium]|nr:extracellular solute-binding protein [Clostridia bacterium]